MLDKLNSSKLMQQAREMPMFPVIPLLPLGLALGVVAMSAFSLWRVGRLEERLENLGLIGDELDYDDLSSEVVDTLSSANPDSVTITTESRSNTH